MAARCAPLQGKGNQGAEKRSQRQTRSQRRRQTRNQSARKKGKGHRMAGGFQGYRNWCAEWGHKEAQCPYRRERDRVDDKFEFCDFGQQANLLEHNGPMLGLGSREDFSTTGGGRFWQGSRLSLALSRILRIDARASVQLRSVKFETSFVIDLRCDNCCLDTIPPTICCLAATVTTTMTTSTTWSIIVATLLV